MNAATVRSELQTLVATLLRSKLARDTNAIIVRQLASSSLVTWRGSTESEPFSDPGQFASFAEYRRLVCDREYTCLLSDGALLQMSYLFERDRLLKHRLLYFPCPILLDDSAGWDEPGFDLSALLDDRLVDTVAQPDDHDHDTDTRHTDGLLLRSPLRFDFDLEAQTPDHPGSHLHLLNEDVRWAVFGPLSIGHFVRFVFRHFYPLDWTAHSSIRQWPMSFGDRTTTAVEERELFIECRAAIAAG